MKKVIVAIMILGAILLSYGCDSKKESTVQGVKPEVRRNIVTQTPPANTVTYEIDEKLVGKYVADLDPEMYFEIMSDGRVELSIVDVSGEEEYTSDMTKYIKYNYDKLELTAYYFQNSRTYIKETFLAFHLIGGTEYFPMHTGQMSLEFASSWETKNCFDIKILDKWVGFVKVD